MVAFSPLITIFLIKERRKALLSAKSDSSRRLFKSSAENNWIENTGIDWKLPTHNLQPERFQLGWGHGILVEDSNQVRIINNRILSATENGIEIRNSREVEITGNGIDCNQAGIGVYRYNEYSLYRDFSPLSEENAGDSQVIANNNVIYSAQKDYDVDESCQFTLVE